jgi:hypothetical protein
MRWLPKLSEVEPGFRAPKFENDKEEIVTGILCRTWDWTSPQVATLNTIAPRQW